MTMLPCFHYFPSGCIEPWLERSAQCPVCKHRVDDVDNVESADHGA